MTENTCARDMLAYIDTMADVWLQQTHFYSSVDNTRKLKLFTTQVNILHNVWWANSDTHGNYAVRVSNSKPNREHIKKNLSTK